MKEPEAEKVCSSSEAQQEQRPWGPKRLGVLSRRKSGVADAAKVVRRRDAEAGGRVEAARGPRRWFGFYYELKGKALEGFKIFFQPPCIGLWGEH